MKKIQMLLLIVMGLVVEANHMLLAMRPSKRGHDDMPIVEDRKRGNDGDDRYYEPSKVLDSGVYQDYREQFIAAIVAGNMDIVGHFIKNCGVDINTTDQFGNSVLCLAAENNYWHIVEYFLLQCRPNVYVINQNGDTILHIAARKDHLEAFKYLIKTCGMPINTPNKFGKTPLSCGVGAKIFRFLIAEKKVKINVQPFVDAIENFCHRAARFSRALFTEETEID